MRGIRHFLRQYTAMATKEHLRSEVEDQSRPPELTANEIELVRYVRGESFDWDAYLAKRR
jgi:hypothetical protein